GGRYDTKVLIYLILNRVLICARAVADFSIQYSIPSILILRLLGIDRGGRYDTKVLMYPIPGLRYQVLNTKSWYRV
uniref:Uncharacterized protein n=1 Tax=Amphimedon queenslandica TaxID=400682 RepID=A0A1X7U2A3_AMPQE